MTQSIFLTEEEMQALTGYSRQSDRRRWLQSRGFKFEVSAIGKPVVLRSHLEARLSEPLSHAPETWAPNLAAMKKVA